MPFSQLERLLHRREDVYRAILEDRGLRRLWLELAIVVVLGGAVYGAIFGLWRSPVLALYVAIKLPLLLLATSCCVMLLNWIGCRLLGAELSFAQAGVLSWLAMAIASVVLLGLAPVALLFVASAPDADIDSRVTHNVLLLVHVVVIGTAGVYGTRFLRRALARLSSVAGRGRAIYLLWLGSYLLVGAQLAWIFRPWVGSIYHDVVFVRPDALDGNFYEFLFTDVIPRLLTGRKLHEP